MNYIQKLRREISDIESLFVELLNSVRIEYNEPNSDPY